MPDMRKKLLEEKVWLVVSWEFKRQRLADLLCSAVEGGSGYWANFSEFNRTEDLDYLAVTVTDMEADKPVTKRIDLDDMLEGLKKLAVSSMPKRHLQAFLEENDDAETADVVLQMAMFGEVVYG